MTLPVVTAAPTTTEPATTTSPATTVAPTTTTTAPAPTTTVPPETTTTVAATTTVPAAPTVPGGWQNAASFDPAVYAPLDEGNWLGVPSPALPAAGQPLADGIYEAVVATPWSAADPGSLSVIVHRLDLCTNLPADGCTNLGDPYMPNELGPNEANPLPLTIPLDASIAVGVTGFECQPVYKTGNGADLANLFTAYDAAYSAAILPQVQAGTDVNTILSSIIASPSNGFSDSDATCGGPTAMGIVYQSGDSPPLLLQTVADQEFDSNGTLTKSDPLTPTTTAYLNAIQVKDGVMTLYFYAGFYS
ncbi:MAG TPA: hypothetical protein VGM78_07925 [Ilumatobacteraceae bacterium]